MINICPLLTPLTFACPAATGGDGGGPLLRGHFVALGIEELCGLGRAVPLLTAVEAAVRGKAAELERQKVFGWLVKNGLSSAEARVAMAAAREAIEVRGGVVVNDLRE